MLALDRIPNPVDSNVSHLWVYPPGGHLALSGQHLRVSSTPHMLSKNDQTFLQPHSLDWEESLKEEYDQTGVVKS